MGRYKMNGEKVFLIVLSILIICTFISSSVLLVSATTAKHHLRKLLEATVLTIQSPDGDMIHCVPREKQPAFDHPLLQNHTLQDSPSYVPKEFEDMLVVAKSTMKHSNTSTSLSDSLFGSQLWHQSGRCPEHTVPIRRPSPSDILDPQRARQYRNPNITTINMHARRKHDSRPLSHEYAIAQLDHDPIYGALGKFNLWKPIVATSNEMSIAQIWLVSGSYSGTFLDTVEAGWTVEPGAYGDTNTRFFVYWTNDYYKSSGCLDLRCPGFVQVSYDMLLGGAFAEVSTYKGPQRELRVLIWKDKYTWNWWLRVGNTDIGYWPAILFRNGLQEKATTVQWGGEITNSFRGGLHTTTQMGSGHLSNEGYGIASYVRSLEIVDSSPYLSDIPSSTIYRASNPFCYSVTRTSRTKWGPIFFFGGPGRSSYCV